MEKNNAIQESGNGMEDVERIIHSGKTMQIVLGAEKSIEGADLNESKKFDALRKIIEAKHAIGVNIESDLASFREDLEKSTWDNVDGCISLIKLYKSLNVDAEPFLSNLKTAYTKVLEENTIHSTEIILEYAKILKSAGIKPIEEYKILKQRCNLALKEDDKRKFGNGSDYLLLMAQMSKLVGKKNETSKYSKEYFDVSMEKFSSLSGDKIACYQNAIKILYQDGLRDNSLELLSQLPENDQIEILFAIMSYSKVKDTSKEMQMLQEKILNSKAETLKRIEWSCKLVSQMFDKGVNPLFQYTHANKLIGEVRWLSPGYRNDGGVSSLTPYLIEMYAKANRIDYAKTYFNNIGKHDGAYKKSREGLISGIIHNNKMEEALDEISKIDDVHIRNHLYESVVNKMIKTKTVFTAITPVLRLMSEGLEKNDAILKLCDYGIEKGDYDYSFRLLENSKDSIDKSDYVNKKLEIATGMSKGAMSVKELGNIPEDEIVRYMKSYPPEFAFAVGILRGGIPIDNDIENHKKVSFSMGEGVVAENPDAILTKISKEIFSSGQPIDKRVFAKLISNFDNNIISKYLIPEIRRTSNENILVRLLKPLLEVENMKARQIASTLSMDESLPKECREYLIGKLFATGYWNMTLGYELESKIQKGEDKEDVYKILNIIVTKIKVVPDPVIYNLLERKGDLTGNTLDERVEELLKYKEMMESVGKEKLLELFKQSKKYIKIYFCLYAGENSYPSSGDYNYNRFDPLINEVLGFRIDEDILNHFRQIMINSGKTDEEADVIVEKLLTGKPPIDGSNIVTFNTSTEFGSEKAFANERFNTVMNVELKKILEIFSIGSVAENLGEVDHIHEGSNEKLNSNQKNKKITNLISTLELNGNFKYDKLEQKIKSFRSELRNYYKTTGNKDELLIIDTVPNSYIINKYFEAFYPKLHASGAFGEWMSHLKETLTILEKGDSVKGIIPERSVDIELTFIDKGEDMLRYLRATDAYPCCFNSENSSQSHWVAGLYADPLSFCIDIQEKGTKTITGFIFGRFGFDDHEKPIIMLNGIYSKFKGKKAVDNYLKIIELKMADFIGASQIVLAGSHGGTIDASPDNYEKKNSLELNAIRALQNQDEIYDDIGNVANGKFMFSGFVKKLK